MSPKKSPSQPQRVRTAAEIEADLVKARHELTEAVDALAERVDPRRPIANLKARAKGFATDLKNGKTGAVAAAGAAGAAVIGLTAFLIVRSRKH